MNDRSLGIFAKEPRPGQVKSRLAAVTSPEWAAKVADAFLRDTVSRLAQVDAERFLVYDPAEGREYFPPLAGNRYELLPQEGGDLGRRMEQFILGRLQAGAQRIVIVGADSPTLPPEWIERAFQELAKSDLVLGPATDGGYYLLGCAGAPPPIFDHISWGTERVLCETIGRLTNDAGRLALLPPWYDVDTLADLWSLKGHLAALQRAGLDLKISHTQQLIEDFP
jgi:rSAM/selenodomain-associated transferase 1